jgi:hypothetical protein
MAKKLKNINVPKWLNSKYFLFGVSLILAGGLMVAYITFAGTYDIRPECTSLSFAAIGSTNPKYATAVKNSKYYPSCVRQIEYSLNQICRSTDIPVDGVFDKAQPDPKVSTKYRVAQFQKDSGLVTDGIVGTTTWNNLAHYRYNSQHGLNSLNCSSIINYPSYSY